MIIERLIADVTPVGSSAGAEHNILRMILGVDLLIQTIFVVRKPLWDVEIPSWALIPFLSRVIYWKYVEWLLAGVTPAVSPDRAERAILGMILDVFWPIQGVLVVGEPLCDVGIGSQAIVTLLRVI